MTYIPFISGDGVAKHTQNAATKIRVALGGAGKWFTHVINMRYTDTGTAHLLTLMRGATRTTVVGAVAAAGTAVTLKTALFDGAGNVMAASDVLSIRLSDGSEHVTTVSSVTGTALVLTDAVPTGLSILDGARITCYGVATDAMHAHQIYDGGASSAAINVPAVAGETVSLCRASATGEPIIFDSNNLTNAGTLNYANFAFSNF